MPEQLVSTAFGFYAYAGNDRPLPTEVVVTPLAPDTVALKALREHLRTDRQIAQLENDEAFQWSTPAKVRLYRGAVEQRPISRQSFFDGLRLRLGVSVYRRKQWLQMKLGGLTNEQVAGLGITSIGAFEGAEPFVQQVPFDSWEVRQFVLQLEAPRPGEAYAFHVEHRSAAFADPLGTITIVFLPGYGANLN